MWIYFVLICISLWAYYVSSRREFYRLQKKIPGPVGYPFIGTAIDFMKNMGRTYVTLSKFVDEFGDRIFFYFGPVPVLLVNNVEDMEKICTSTELIHKSMEYGLIRDWLGDGLLLSSDSLWAHRRKLLTPCFHFSILDNFIGPINKHANTLVHVLKAEYSQKSDFQDISTFVQKCTLDIILETSMGQQYNCQTSDDTSVNAFLQAIHRVGELFQYRSIRPWLHSDFVWRLTSQGKEHVACCSSLHAITDKVIAGKKKTLNSAGSMETIYQADDDDIGCTKRVKRPLLDLLLEAQAQDPDSITDVGLRDEITNFIFAGHDTVANAISFCLYSLGNSPDAFLKVREELSRVLGNNREHQISSSDLKELKYLEFCIKETLRLYPSAPHLGRVVKKPFKLDENTVIPPGVGVHLLPVKLHRNPKYWPNPEKFIPERFDPENAEHGKTTRSPFCYIPFSAGPRNCIGQKLAMIEAKIILASVLRNFTLESEFPGEKLQLLTEIVLRAEGGLKMKFKYVSR